MTGDLPLADEAWRALGGDGAQPVAGAVPVSGRAPAGRAYLPSPLPVEELGIAAVSCALRAAADLTEARGARRPEVTLDATHVAAACTSERHLAGPGAVAGDAFAPLSAFLPAADGWVRLHANYPHHLAALLRALEVAGPDAVPDAVARRPAAEVAERVVATGGCGVAVRDEDGWTATDSGAALHGRTLLDLEPGGPSGRALPAPGPLPASGVRVLDLTRVIAGPVGTRMLAALGADVLRVDPPHRPELARQAQDTGPGKRSAVVDLRTAPGRAVLEDLLAGADVLVTGYRPGALDAYGLGRRDLAARHPHLGTVTLSAWGDRGPWADRRGFDSLVQAAVGIARVVAPGAADVRPGALPAQMLDHATGYLVTAAALRAVTERVTTGRTAHGTLALARTAHRLLARPRTDVPEPAPLDADRHRVAFGTPAGELSVIGPPGRLDGEPLTWTRGPSAAGADRPVWTS